MRLGSDWRISLEAVAAYEAAHTTAPAVETVQPIRAAASPAMRPAVDLGGEYEPVVKGPVPWRSSVLPAASPAARRGGSATTKKAGVQR